jgi:hypothetical protein
MRKKKSILLPQRLIETGMKISLRLFKKSAKPKEIY